MDRHSIRNLVLLAVAVLLLPAVISSDYTIYLPTVSRTAIQLYALTGVVFHDMNGDGIQDVSYGIDEAGYSGTGWRDMTSAIEPPIGGAVVHVGTRHAATNENGEFTLQVPAGAYDLHIEREGFRYYFASDSSMMPLDVGIPITISGDTSRHLGIGIGCFTLPQHASDISSILLHSYTDIDPTPGQAGRYNRNNDVDSGYMTVGTGDTHRGIDYWAASPGGDVLAMAPGMVYSAALADDGMRMIVILHTDYEGVQPSTEPRIRWASVGLQSSYHHLGSFASGIESGAWVRRGQVIGSIGNHQANGGYHLHAEAVDCSYKDLMCCPYVDLFRDTFHTELSFPCHNNCSQGPCYPLRISRGSPGYWTADNHPQFALTTYTAAPIRGR